MLPIKFDSAVSRIFLRACSISSQPSIAQHNTNLIRRFDREDATMIKVPSKTILHPFADADGENGLCIFLLKEITDQRLVPALGVWIEQICYKSDWGSAQGEI